MTSSAMEQWQDGLLTDEQALRSLASDLGECESELEPLKEQRERLREHISHVLAHAGGRAEIKGFGFLQITAPSVVVGYDADRLDRLVAALAETHPDIAARIVGCKVSKPRAGSLRINREK